MACRFKPPIRHGIPLLAGDLADVGSPDYPGAAFGLWEEFERANAFWFRPRARLIAELRVRHFPGAGSFFELGCGSGSVLETITHDPSLARVVGADASLDGLMQASRRAPSAELIQLDAHRMPYREEFDVAGAFDVIEHFDHDIEVLAGLCDSVLPGGGVLITVPQHPRLWSQDDDIAGHKRRYRRRELRAKAESVGLEVLTMSSYVFAPLPAMAVKRLRRRPPGYDPLVEGAKGVPLAGLLERILRAEARAVVAGVSLPVGGSLIMAGRRKR